MNTGEQTSDEQDLLTVSEVARLLRVSQNCVYELVAKGKVPAYRVGARRGTIRIKRDHVHAYLEASRVVNAEPKVHLARPRLKHLTI
jgi:excisionase family DNA binding protein